MTRPFGTLFCEICIKLQRFSNKKMDLKMSAKWQPFCLGLNIRLFLWKNGTSSRWRTRDITSDDHGYLSMWYSGILASMSLQYHSSKASQINSTVSSRACPGLTAEKSSTVILDLLRGITRVLSYVTSYSNTNNVFVSNYHHGACKILTSIMFERCLPMSS